MTSINISTKQIDSYILVVCQTTWPTDNSDGSKGPISSPYKVRVVLTYGLSSLGLRSELSVSQNSRNPRISSTYKLYAFYYFYIVVLSVCVSKKIKLKRKYIMTNIDTQETDYSVYILACLSANVVIGINQ